MTTIDLLIKKARNQQLTNEQLMQGILHCEAQKNIHGMLPMEYRLTAAALHEIYRERHGEEASDALIDSLLEN